MNAVLYLFFGAVISSWLIVALVCFRDYLAIRKESKELDATLERVKFKQEMRIMIHGMVWGEVRYCKRDLTRYIDTKLAEKDKQAETREEDKHE